MPSGFSLAGNAQARAIIHSRWNLDSQNFLSPDPPFAIAFQAGIAVYLSGSAALWAGSGHCEEALRIAHLATPGASRASGHLRAILRTGTMAACACFAARYLDFGIETGGSFFERDLQFISKVGATLGTCAAATPMAEKVFEVEEGSKQILEPGEDG